MLRFRATLLCFFISVTALFAAPPKPKLVLAIVIDQFRYDYLLRFKKDYNSGFIKMMDRGANYENAHYVHATTVTAVGHSTFLSGAPPSISGIIGNEWFERKTNQRVTSVSDPDTKLVSSTPDRTGSSPRRMLVSTVGDELKMQGNDSKVIGISIKDRSAILPAGHMADAAYWYDNQTNEWVTSTYYRPDRPEWVNRINAEKTVEKLANARWTPIDNKDAKPFCGMAKNADLRACGAIEATPWGNEMIEAFAEAALTGENLGRHNSPDILAVSFSSNDYVGHAVGPDDPEVRDMSIRTDRLLGKLFEAAERQAGAGNVLIVITADHGVAPVPEVNQKRNMPGGRLTDAPLRKKINDALAARFGSGDWLLPGAISTAYLNYTLIAQYKADAAEVERVAADAIRNEPHIARVYTRHQLENGQVQQDSISRAVSLSFFGPRSGDLYVVPEPYYMFDASGTTHGLPYNYDTHVPLMILGSGIKPGTYSRPVAVNDLAPTLAIILGVTDPSGSIGTPLAEILQ